MAPANKSHQPNSAATLGSTTAQDSSRWLLLTDFASKYRISVSTLRRRIKAGQQEHRFEGGRYYLPDVPVPHDEPATHAPVKQGSVAGSQPMGSQTAASILASSMTPGDEPLITTTSKLLNELKQAYTLILHEKEEQIIHLKEEIADLKTLIRVLESENARLVSERDRKMSEKGPYGTA